MAFGWKEIAPILLLGPASPLVYQQRQAASAAKAEEKAASDAATAAEQQASLLDQQFNAANQKKPDIGSLLAANIASSKGGISSTSLTGPGGIDPSKLLLGKSTLLGG